MPHRHQGKIKSYFKNEKSLPLKLSLIKNVRSFTNQITLSLVTATLVLGQIVSVSIYNSTRNPFTFKLKGFHWYNKGYVN